MEFKSKPGGATDEFAIRSLPIILALEVEKVIAHSRDMDEGDRFSLMVGWVSPIHIRPHR